MVFSQRKKDKFSELFIQLANNLQSTAQSFSQRNFSHHHEFYLFLEEMKKYKNTGNELMQKIKTELNQTFITPIDREDLFELGLYIEEVVASLDHVASLLDTYSLTKLTEKMMTFLQLIYQCSIEITLAVQCLFQKKLQEILTYSIKIKNSENESTHFRKKAVKQLFSSVKDPLKLIQYKDVYESLEKSVGDCCKVANILDRIVMKNS